MLKRLKNIEDKIDNQLDLTRDQGNKPLGLMKSIGSCSNYDFYDGADERIKNVVKTAKEESFDNVIKDKIFPVTISGDDFSVGKYINLSQFGSDLFSDRISLDKAKDDQEKISKKLMI